MLIRVMYKDNTYDIVKHTAIDHLIESRKIKKFLRAEGWAEIGVHSIRGMGGVNKGPERREIATLIS